MALALVLCGAHGARAEAPAKPESAAEKPSGRLTVENETVDVGQVVRGETATATFVLKNTGSETLKILSAKPG
jgi:hypothetical protein